MHLIEQPILQSEIDRYTAVWENPLRAARLRFSQALERQFKTDCADQRLRELKFTIPLSFAFYLITTVSDPVFVPDLGLHALYLRLVVIAFGVVTLMSGLRFGLAVAENLLTGYAFFAILGLEWIAAHSIAPLHAYGFATVWLAVAYANTTFPLRFAPACLVSALSLMSAAILVLNAQGLSVGLTLVIGLQAVCAAIFSVIASYRIERSMRLTYLLVTLESKRVRSLNVERVDLLTRSDTDGLTGLTNRGCFDRRLSGLLTAPGHDCQTAALIMLDVDHFKRYNDGHGHPAGDACLKRIAQVLAAQLRTKQDIAARYGGEEFIVLLLGITDTEALMVAHRIRHAVENLAIPHHDRGDGLAVVTISSGVAFATINETTSITALVEAADRALYAAKRSRNTVSILSDAFPGI
jgi:diguanylate cyclase (GGDEF)-like protein